MYIVWWAGLKRVYIREKGVREGTMGERGRGSCLPCKSYLHRHATVHIMVPQFLVLNKGRAGTQDVSILGSIVQDNRIVSGR
jgi:hypothetical protein